MRKRKVPEVHPGSAIKTLSDQQIAIAELLHAIDKAELMVMKENTTAKDLIAFLQKEKHIYLEAVTPP